jgi:hypothetical protein
METKFGDMIPIPRYAKERAKQVKFFNRYAVDEYVTNMWSDFSGGSRDHFLIALHPELSTQSLEEGIRGHQSSMMSPSPDPRCMQSDRLERFERNEDVENRVFQRNIDSFNDAHPAPAVSKNERSLKGLIRLISNLDSFEDACEPFGSD